MELVQQSRAYRPPATAMLIGVAALGLLALLMLNFPILILGVVAVAGAISIVWAARRVQGNARASAVRVAAGRRVERSELSAADQRSVLHGSLSVADRILRSRGLDCVPEFGDFTGRVS